MNANVSQLKANKLKSVIVNVNITQMMEIRGSSLLTDGIYGMEASIAVGFKSSHCLCLCCWGGTPLITVQLTHLLQATHLQAIKSSALQYISPGSSVICQCGANTNTRLKFSCLPEPWFTLFPCALFSSSSSVSTTPICLPTCLVLLSRPSFLYLINKKCFWVWKLTPPQSTLKW